MGFTHHIGAAGVAKYVVLPLFCCLLLPAVAQPVFSTNSLQLRPGFRLHEARSYRVTEPFKQMTW